MVQNKQLQIVTHPSDKSLVQYIEKLLLNRLHFNLTTFAGDSNPIDDPDSPILFEAKDGTALDLVATGRFAYFADETRIRYLQVVLLRLSLLRDIFQAQMNSSYCGKTSVIDVDVGNKPWMSMGVR